MTLIFDGFDFNSNGDLVTVDSTLTTSWSSRVEVINTVSTSWSIQQNVQSTMRTTWSVASGCQYSRIAAPDNATSPVISSLNFSYVLLEKEITKTQKLIASAQTDLYNAQLVGDLDAANFAQAVIDDQQAILSNLQQRLNAVLALPYDGAFIAKVTYCSLIGK